MKSLNDLIDRVRRYTLSQSYTDSSTASSQRGIQTQTFVDLFNDAQRNLQTILYSNAPSVFITTGTIDLVAEQEEYSLPSGAFMNGALVAVEYKWGSGSGDYTRLNKRVIAQRSSAGIGTPRHYIHFGGTLWINPRPSTSTTAGLRVTYESQKPDVDVRRGKISSYGGTSTAPTSIVLDSSTNSLGEIALAGDLTGQYITVVDKDGNQQMKAIPITAYNAGTDTITLGSFTAASGEEIAAGDWIVIGSNATTHSQFPDLCESYLVAFVKHRIFDILGDPQSDSALLEVTKLENSLSEAFDDINYDIEAIPEIDISRLIDY